MSERAGIYARVSTEDQSVKTQLQTLERLAANLGLTIPAGQTYADRGVSGRLDSRPEFDRLLEAIRTRQVDVVLVTKLDRIARSVQTALQFFAEAEAAGVRVIVTDQAIDTGTPTGRLTRTIVAAIAEFEGDLIRERTQVAMDAIRSGSRKTRSGRPVGRPRRVTPEIVAKIAELRAASYKWSEIAQRVGLPAETCRRSSWKRKGTPVGVENSPAGIIPPGPGREGPR
jgi:DNA invertase Pin-like site-specific DNA recombinase